MPTPPLSAINLGQKPLLAACAHSVHRSGTERFRLAHHWSLHLYQYHARVRVADVGFAIVPGSLTLVPPGSLIEYQFQGASPHIFAHFILPEASQGGSVLSLPVFYELGSDLRYFEQSLAAVAESLPMNRLRAEIKLWDLLWDLAEQSRKATPRRHLSFEKALRLIEMRLGENISVTELARQVGVSHNHLTRLFHQETGSTVVAYIRRQRAELAKHLLAHTTMPLQAIAAQINAANHQSFSSLMKKETGHPPSYWRGSGGNL